jgi:hypothetical protein
MRENTSIVAATRLGCWLEVFIDDHVLEYSSRRREANKVTDQLFPLAYCDDEEQQGGQRHPDQAIILVAVLSVPGLRRK